MNFLFKKQADDGGGSAGVVQAGPGLPSPARPAVSGYRCESGSPGCAGAAAVPYVRSCSELGSRAEMLWKEAGGGGCVGCEGW